MGDSPLASPGSPDRAVLIVATLQKADPHTGLVLIEEPWVTYRPTRRCRGAVAKWYLAFRADRDVQDPAHRLVDRCGLDSSPSQWGWDAADYGLTVAAIEQHVGRRATRFVGASFAGVRLSYLHRRWERVDLVSPLPAGVRMDRYVRARQRLLDEHLGRCPRCASARPAQVAGRSVPVTGFDRVSAAVAAGYLAPGHAQRTYAQIISGTSAADLDLIGRLSDSALGRIGAHDLSPAVLAIWSEQCRAMRAARAVREDGFFSRYLSPCAFIAPQAGRSRPVRAARTCVSLAERDPVVPVGLSRTGYDSPATSFHGFSGAHATVRGLARCL